MHAVTWQSIFIGQNYNHASSTVNKSLNIGLIDNKASNTCHKTLTYVLIGA